MHFYSQVSNDGQVGQRRTSLQCSRARQWLLVYPGFTGSVCPPLSNEIYPIGDDVKIAAPSSAEKVSHAKGEKSSLDHHRMFLHSGEGGGGCP